MPATVIPFRAVSTHRAFWALLEIARPDAGLMPLGILLVDDETDKLQLRLRNAADFPDLDEEEADILAFLKEDLQAKAAESGAAHLARYLEDSLSHFLRISDRTAIEYTGDAGGSLDRLYRDHVGESVDPFVTHLPLYALRAAATKFGEENTGEEERWVRASGRLTKDMFVAQVVGRSMEPLIPDGSLCVFRAGVTGSRQGRRLLIEQFGATSEANRYTVKQYSSAKKASEDADWEHEKILLSPLNREFDAFELGPHEFRVVGEFVRLLDS